MTTNPILTVKVTGSHAILRSGCIAKVVYAGGNLWQVLKSNGRDVYPMTLFLVQDRDFQLTR